MLSMPQMEWMSNMKTSLKVLPTIKIPKEEAKMVALEKEEAEVVVVAKINENFF